MSGAIYVMWIRQIKKTWRSKARIIGSLGQPLLFLLALGFGLGGVFEQAGQGDYTDFLVPGIVAMSIMFTAMFAGIEILWDRQFGFLKETLVAPIARWKIMIGRTLGGSTIAIIQGIIVLLISLLIGFRPASVSGLLFALIFMFLVAFIFTAFGTALASKMTDMQAFPLIMNFLVMPIFFLSGSLFPVNAVPKAIEIIVKLNPLSYGVDGIRHALLGTGNFPFLLDFFVMFDVAIILGLIGTYFFSKIEI
jgi:ABC-2 type transport system permease protein